MAGLLVLPSRASHTGKKNQTPTPYRGVPVKANCCLALDGVGNNFLKIPDAQGAQHDLYRGLTPASGVGSNYLQVVLMELPLPVVTQLD